MLSAMRLRALVVLCAILASSIVRAETSATFLYRLSDFSGPVPYEYPQLAPDTGRGELLVAESDVVRVFGPSGMLVYEFVHDHDRLGPLLDAAVLEDGDVVLLSRAPMVKPGDVRALVTRCDFRGEPRRTFELQDVPEEFAGFFGETLRVRGDRLYFASLSQKRIVVTDLDGRFQRGWDIAATLGLTPKKARDIELGGFDVDRQGNLYVTAPALGQGYRLSPQGVVAPFGDPGSGPGALGIAKGVAVTDTGWIVVSDLLNQVLVVFDPALNPAASFPAAGEGAQALTAPVAVAAGREGLIYVGEMGQKAIAVFQLRTP
ncbi:MAG TPA: hypothetical protein VJS92_09920 [Candidatus Polarisedimenticolaceae bacterium]|nr:hypothetical protein [Candidatus Polarisedimenticolaceae bacterium]